MNGRFLDISGFRFERLVVVKLSHIDKDDHEARWLCRCDCGNSVVVRGSALRKGNTKSCGCYKIDRIKEAKFDDLSGKVFGNLFVIKEVGRTPSGKMLWECSCACGNLIKVPAGDLRSGKHKSCGCQKWVGEQNPRWRGGKFNNLYPPEWNKKLRKHIRNLDSNMCRFPKCMRFYQDRKLDVHHIDGNKMNCKDENLISLCNHHHQWIESHNPREWESYFYSLTACRTND